jgi:hypothetical protein
MSVFLHEMKKLWNWRVLLVIAVLGVLTWFAFFRDSLSSFESLQTHGSYGAYQTEMFYLYGDTLAPEELAAFDIPGKKAALVSEMNDIIAGESVFAQNDVRDFEDFQELKRLAGSDIPDEEAARLRSIISDLTPLLEEWKDDLTLDEWYDSPLMRYGCLEALEQRYVSPETHIDAVIRNNADSPIIAGAAEDLRTAKNNNLISDYLCPDFSLYAGLTALFAVVAVLLLTLPLLSIDRSRKIHHLQYAAHIGRGIFARQLAAVALSACILSALLVIVSYFLFLRSGGAGDYWQAHMMAHCYGGLSRLWLYNITFGQYVFILAGMSVALCVGAACFGFLLARFSDSIIALMIKAVPAAAALGAIAFLTSNTAFSNYNRVFRDVFAQRLNAPEVWVCGVMAIAGIVAALLVLAREKKTDVT